MTIHHYLMQASKDDARRAGERDRVLLEARRLGLTRPPGAGLAALVTRGARLLSRRAGWARGRLGLARTPPARTNPAGSVWASTHGHRPRLSRPWNQPQPDPAQPADRT
jgi:hypothetical protein